MKKIFFIVLAIGVFFTIATAPASAQRVWEGKMSGSGYTDTSNSLKQFQSFTGGCGNSCDGKSFMSMGAKQSGDAGLKLYGKEKVVDLVTGSGKFEYNTGYAQKAATPNGYQEQWGSQSGKVEGLIKSR